jgi:hypothetical protein
VGHDILPYDAMAEAMQERGNAPSSAAVIEDRRGRG